MQDLQLAAGNRAVHRLLSGAPEGPQVTAVLQASAGNVAVGQRLGERAGTGRPAAAGEEGSVAAATSVEDKAARVTAALDAWFGTESELLTIFDEAAEQGQFLDLQDQVEMDAVFEELSPQVAAAVGRYRPVVKGREKLNQKRAEYIVEIARDFGLAEGEVVVHHLFAGMYDDDIEDVMKRLGAERRLASTVLGEADVEGGGMPAVRDLLVARDIDPSKFAQRPSEVGDLLRGAGEWLGHAAESPEAKNARFTKLMATVKSLPQEYQDIYGKIVDAETKEAWSTGNLTRGFFDYLTFGIPLGLYETAKSTGKGVWHLGTGEWEKAGGELMPAVVILATHAATRGLGRLAARGERGLTMPEYTGPLPKPHARLLAILRHFGPSAETAGAQLLAELTEAQIVEAAAYLRRNPEAAAFVQRGGTPALHALLEAKGDVAAAQGTRPLLPEGKTGAVTSEMNTADPTRTTYVVKKQSADPSDQAEVRSAEKLAHEGYDTRFTSQGHGEPDLTVDQKPSDVKLLTSTASTNIRNTVGRGLRQGTQVVVDGSHVGLTVDQAVAGIEMLEAEAKKHPGKYTNLEQVIFVLGDGSTYVHNRLGAPLTQPKAAP